MTTLKTRNQCQIVAMQPNDASLMELDEMLRLAVDAQIPAIVCSVEIISPTVLEAIKCGLDKDATLGRHTVLLCGAYLEEQILVVAQYLLVAGFDLYLLRDLVLTLVPDHALIHDSRLVQAGAVMTTSRQVIYEWITQESDSAVQARLAAFLKA